MKSKKKLLLLGVGAMSALALGVGATSTFAWYQSASAGLTAKGKVYSPNISVSTETDKIQLAAADLPFDQLFTLAVAEDGSTSTKGLELAHYRASGGPDTTHKLGTGYIDGSGTFHESDTLADGSGNVLAKKFNVTITMKNVSTVTDSSSNVWTLSDALAAIYSQKFKIYVDADSKTGERARVFNSTAAETLDDQGDADATNDTYDNIVQINSGDKALSGLITESAGVYSKTADVSLTYSFWVYVWGKETGTSLTADSTSITGSVRVTVQNSTESAPAAWDSSAA